MQKLKFEKENLVKHISHPGVFRVIYSKGAPPYRRISSVGLLQNVNELIEEGADYLIENVATRDRISVTENLLLKSDYSFIPKKEFNIYPLTKENVDAILIYYFNNINFPDGGDLFQLFIENNLVINQIEFIVRQVSEEIEYFKNLSAHATKHARLSWAIFVLSSDGKQAPPDNTRAERFLELVSKKLFVNNF